MALGSSPHPVSYTHLVQDAGYNAALPGEKKTDKAEAAPAAGLILLGGEVLFFACLLYTSRCV